MIDVHCHLQFEAFESDYEKVMQDAFAAGVTTIINTGTQLSSSKKGVEFAQKYEKLYAIVGVHPHHADKIAENTNWLNELEELTKHPKTVGIGEIGMDYFSYKSNGIVDPTM